MDKLTREDINVIDDEQLLKMARQSITKPEDFGHWGRSDMFNTWGFGGIDYCGESSLYDKSNWDALIRIFKADSLGIIKDGIFDIDKDDLDTENYKHWAVGEIDRVIVKVLKDLDRGLVIDNIADSFRIICWFHNCLEDYPIFDEDDYWTMVTEMKMEKINDILHSLPLEFDANYDGDIVSEFLFEIEEQLCLTDDEVLEIYPEYIEERIKDGELIVDDLIFFKEKKKECTGQIKLEGIE
tara:strand:- start:3376 stop:4095 length:720 start_codon:yes stop_codon:yes gene_type:complete